MSNYHNQKRDLRVERAIVEYRNNGKTFQEIADMFGISRQRAHQIFDRANRDPYVPFQPAPHGTTARYLYGCRCDSCGGAISHYRRSRPSYIARLRGSRAGRPRKYD